MYGIDSNSTSTPGKLHIENTWKNLLLQHLKYPRNSYYVGLVGKSDGLLRHLKDAIDLGFDEDHIIFIERNKDIFNELCIEAAKLDINCIIVNGDYKIIINHLFKAGHHIGVVDFDGTEVVKQYHWDLINLCYKYGTQVSVINIVASLRYNSTDFRTMQQQLIEIYGYNLAARTYYGAGNMISFILSEQLIPVEYTESYLRHQIQELYIPRKFGYHKIAELLNLNPNHVRRNLPDWSKSKLRSIL
jgi:hypothetical protein